MHSFIILNPTLSVTMLNSNIKIMNLNSFTMLSILDGIQIKVSENKIYIFQKNKTKLNKANFGLFLSLLKNKIEGLSKNFFKILKISGNGYKFVLENNSIVIFAGKTKNNIFFIPAEITLTVNDFTHLTVAGSDKILVGNFASIIRSVRPIEPYKFRGISYIDENILKKEGKKRK